MIELSLLKSMLSRENYDKYFSQIRKDSISDQCYQLLVDFGIYFSKFPKADNIGLKDFKDFCLVVLHSDFTDVILLEYDMIIERINTSSEEAANIILQSLDKKYVYECIQRLEKTNADLEKVQGILDSRITNKPKEVDQDMDITEALKFVDRSNGLKWRLPCLQDHFNGGLISGDLILIGGYTDSGKTSFMASEVSYMAQQLDDDDQILWFNNEGAWKRILPRIYCAALGCTQEDLNNKTDRAIEKYTKLMKGNKNRIQVIDIQGKSIYDIESILKAKKTKLIVFDLLDEVKGFDKFVSTSDGSVERYDRLYHWALEKANEFNCPILAVSQLNREAYNNMYPALTMMKGSGVAKQTAATAVLFIGELVGQDRIRYLSTPKFKLHGNKFWQTEVVFNPEKSRFL